MLEIFKNIINLFKAVENLAINFKKVCYIYIAHDSLGKESGSQMTHLALRRSTLRPWRGQTEQSISVRQERTG